MNTKPRLLIITLATTRSGVPMLTLHLIRQLVAMDLYEISVVLMGDGVMVPDFKALVPTAIFNDPEMSTNPLSRWIARHPAMVRRRIARQKARCRAIVGAWPPDLVFCNSAAASGVLDALGPYSCPVVVGVHEMEFAMRVIRNWVPVGPVPAIRRHATHFAAGSGAVKNYLVDTLGIAPAIVSVVHAFIPVDEFVQTAATKKIDRLRPGAVAAGGVSGIEWRKGTDLLAPLALEMAKRESKVPVDLVWVGGGAEDLVADVKFDLRRAGQTTRVHLAGATSKTADWYPSFSVFALLSREDPFPLVALEAAACGVPIVCFADAGGMPEFVESDCGIVVPYLDLPAFADAILKIAGDPELRARLGANAAAKVRARHDVGVGTRQLIAVLQEAAT